MEGLTLESISNTLVFGVEYKTRIDINQLSAAELQRVPSLQNWWV